MSINYGGVRELFVPYCADWSSYTMVGVKTGELVYTTQSQEGVWWKQKVSFTTKQTHQSAVKTEQLWGRPCETTERGEDGE